MDYLRMLGRGVLALFIKPSSMTIPVLRTIKSTLAVPRLSLNQRVMILWHTARFLLMNFMQMHSRLQQI